MPNCFVSGCSFSWRPHQQDVTLHVFPKNEVRIKLWLNQCGLTDSEKAFLVPKILACKQGRYRVCSLHFSEEDFIRRGTLRGLKKNAIPTRSLPPPKEQIIEMQDHSYCKTPMLQTASSLDGSTECTSVGEGTGSSLSDVQSQIQDPTSSRSHLHLSEKYTFSKKKAVYISEEYVTPLSLKEEYTELFHPIVSGDKRKRKIFQDMISKGTNRVYFPGQKHNSTQTRKRFGTKQKSIQVSIRRRRWSIGIQCEMVQLPPISLLAPVIDAVDKHQPRFQSSFCEQFHNFENPSRPRRAIPCEQKEIGGFEDVAVYFSKEEWDCLNKEEKEMYKEVMMENYQTLQSLGRIIVKPSIISMIERGEEPCVWSLQHSENKEVLGNLSRNLFQTSFKARPSLDRDEDLILENDYVSEESPKKVNTNTKNSKSGGSSKLLSKTPMKMYKPNHRGYKVKDLNHFRTKNVSEKTDKRGLAKSKTFVCSKRGLSLHNESDRTNNCTRDKEKPYCCSECGKILSCSINLKIHLQLHTGMKPFSCSECSKCFISSRDLQNHKRIHTNFTWHACSECGKAFRTKVSLMVHSRTHTGKHPFPCQVCGKRFISKNKLTSHQQIHSSDKPFSCPICGKSFKSSFQCKGREKFHAIGKAFPCSECEKELVTKSIIDNHFKMHTGERPFTDSQSRLLMHTGERHFKCQVCDKTFTKHSTLVVHIRSHTGERPFECSECGKTFIARPHLTCHERIHKEITSFTCSECGQCFTNKESVAEHLRIHTGEKPFKCLECGRSFSYKKGLVSHQICHTSEKPFSCTECGELFSRKHNCTRHMKRHFKNKEHH